MIKSAPFLLIIFLLFAKKCFDQKSNNDFKRAGYIDFNGYYDTRNHPTFTINMFAKISNKVNYFSLTNYDGIANKNDLNGLYSEQNVLWQPSNKWPFLLDVQGVIRSGINNDAIRVGPRWLVSKTKYLSVFFKKLNFTYFVTPFIGEVGFQNGFRWMTQIEHVYKIRLWKNRIYLGGFIDQNFLVNNSKKVSLVTEHQIGIRIIDELFLISEYRINQYLNDEMGWGFGLEYKIKFN